MPRLYTVGSQSTLELSNTFQEKKYKREDNIIHGSLMFLVYTCKIKNKHESLLHVSSRYCLFYVIQPTTPIVVNGKICSVKKAHGFRKICREPLGNS